MTSSDRSVSEPEGEAIGTLDKFLQQYPNHKLLPQARRYKADGLFDQKKFADAQKIYGDVGGIEYQAE